MERGAREAQLSAIVWRLLPPARTHGLRLGSHALEDTLAVPLGRTPRLPPSKSGGRRVRMLLFLPFGSHSCGGDGSMGTERHQRILWSNFLGFIPPCAPNLASGEAVEPAQSLSIYRRPRPRSRPTELAAMSRPRPREGRSSRAVRQARALLRLARLIQDRSGPAGGASFAPPSAACIGSGDLGRGTTPRQ